MSANYCEARHKATGQPETHCFHATGLVRRVPGSRETRPVERCCWCEEQTYGFPIAKKHGPFLDRIKKLSESRTKAGRAE